MSVHLSSILQSCPRALLLLSAGEALFSFGEPSDRIYRIETGNVQLTVGHQSRSTSVFLYPGEMLGLSVGRRTCAALAATDCVLTSWPTKSLLELCGGSAEVMMALASGTTQSLATLSYDAARVSHLSPKERVIWLLDWLVRRGRSVTQTMSEHLPTSRREMAEFLSLSPDALGRAIAELEASGYISSVGAGGAGIFHGGRTTSARTIASISSLDVDA